uniref:1-phosphofructokinase n=1 Tax=Candidatus Fimenecus sp. TaxID=3022888 RepID=UPI00402A52F3
MVYTVTLNPALDYVMKLKALRTDDINRTDGEEIYYGGKGINVSVILTQLGIPNTALGFLGGFTGKKLEEMLKNDNISCDFNYLKNGDTRINVKIKADKEIDLNACGPEITKEDMQSFLRKLDGIKSGDYLILAGSIPNTLPDDIYEQILERVGDRNINCVVDATGDLLKNVLKYKPFLIKPNHHELGDLFSVQIKSDDDIVKYSKKLQEMGAKNVLVSMAKDGAMLTDENGNVHKIGNAKGKLINSVGCGDSMVAGFTAGYIKTADYSYALRLGSACGNATAFSEKLATREEIERVFNAEYK